MTNTFGYTGDKLTSFGGTTIAYNSMGCPATFEEINGKQFNTQYCPHPFGCGISASRKGAYPSIPKAEEVAAVGLDVPEPLK